MTANRDLERRVAEYYATEPPLRAPDWVLHAAVSTIEHTPQRRGWPVPRRFRSMSTYAKLLAAGVAVIAVGLIGWSQLGGLGGPGGPPPTPSATPSSTPIPTPSANPATPTPTDVVGTATGFVQPFDYALPGVPVFDFGATNDTYWEVRVPEWADAGHPGGLIIQAIGGGRIDPCVVTSAALPLESATVFEYLVTVPGMTVSNEAATTVDGRPAREATVRLETTTDCPAVWAWVEMTEGFIDGIDLRLITWDVAGEPIAVTIFGEADNPDLPQLADEIVASLRFAAAE